MPRTRKKKTTTATAVSSNSNSEEKRRKKEIIEILRDVRFGTKKDQEHALKSLEICNLSVQDMISFIKPLILAQAKIAEFESLGVGNKSNNQLPNEMLGVF